MNKGYRLLGISIVASTLFTTMLADAHASSSKASMFKEAEATLQSEASDRPVIAPLDRAAPASDPIQKATTKQQKQARFNAEEAAFQEASRDVPAYHPVDRTAAAADPYPKATTNADKKALFAYEERELQKEATP